MVKFGIAVGVWILVVTSSNFYQVNSQELGHFNKSVTVDFEGDKIWAEILPGEVSQVTEEKSGAGKSADITTSAPGIDANKKDVKKQTTSWENPTAVKVIDTGDKVQPTEKTAVTEGKVERKVAIRKNSILSELTPHGRDLGGTPPYITRPVSPNRQVLPEKKNKEFLCVAEGNPTPVYTWYRNNIRLDATGEFIRAFQNGSLMLKDYSERENGVYHCKAVNEYGTDVSVKFYIVAELRPYQDEGTQDVRPMQVKKWQKATIECGKIPDTIPEYTKRWYDVASTEHAIDNRIGMDSEGTLHIAYTELSDSGTEYKCGLAYSSLIALFNPRLLTVVDASDTGDSAPQQEFVTKDSKAIIDKEFILECFFSGKPIPKITWKNNSNHDIHNGDSRYEIFDFGRKLKIKRVRQDDEGLFKCVAENDLAQGVTATIFVNVTTPPLRNSQSLSTYTRPDQNDFTLTCKARAATSERLEPPVWFRNGERLNENDLPDPARYRFNEDQTELTIKSMVKTVDTASYQCNVVNSEGELYMNGYLRVINSIEIKEKPQDVIKLSSNSTEPYDITVRATGDNCCQISILYYFNGSQLSESTLRKAPFRKNDTTDTLSFDPTSMSEDALSDWLGEYRCRVSNLHQTMEDIMFTITLKATNPQPRIAKGDSTGLWWIGIICGILAILIVLIVVFIVYKSNYPGETYQLEKKELKHNLNPEEDLLNQSFQEI